jgi:hypothetical protein
VFVGKGACALVINVTTASASTDPILATRRLCNVIQSPVVWLALQQEYIGNRSANPNGGPNSPETAFSATSI